MSHLLTVSDAIASHARLQPRTIGARDSLGFFALRRDKSVLWSESGKSCLAYRGVSGGVRGSGGK